MKHNPTVKWIALAIVFVAGLAMGIIAGRAGESDVPGRYMVGITVVTVLILLPATIIWWRSIDELAQEAHKSAWFWGGSLGMALSIVPIIVIAELTMQDRLDLDTVEPEVALLLGTVGGTMAVVVPALLGYFGAWIVYWIRKR